MQVSLKRTTPIFAPNASSGVFVQWSVSDVPTGETPTFTLERAGGPEGPFTVVARNLAGFHFYDKHYEATSSATESPAPLALQKNLYYAVSATAGGIVARDVQPVGDQLPTRQFLLRKKIQRDIVIGFKIGSGIPMQILTRRRWGTRCPVCFDKLTKTVTNSKCTSCYGTGYTGGYHDPVRIQGRKGTTNVQVSMSPQGQAEVNQIDFTMLDYPLVATDDVFVEVRTGRRYVVKHVTRTELRGVPVHQKLVLSELARDSVEYLIPAGNGTTPVFY